MGNQLIFLILHLFLVFEYLGLFQNIFKTSLFMAMSIQTVNYALKLFFKPTKHGFKFLYIYDRKTEKKLSQTIVP